ncbi:hypothetical protein [Vibrio cholerae]|uniref:hypothetical protein n=1 Tax=Vibrio cholerae TaxID=666 RepID=UPI000E65DDD9|nr:hypothetical protein [Vibrio cholerae]
MSDLKTRCLIAASGAFLTEFLTEELLSQDDEIIFQFIEDNKWEPVEDYSPEDIWNMIDDHALNLMQFVEAELSTANEEQASNDAPVFLVEIKMQIGETRKTLKSLVAAPSAQKAQHYAIYSESSSPERLEWNANHQASEMHDEIIYSATAEQVAPSDVEHVKKFFGVTQYDEDDLLSSGNYGLIFTK